MGLPTGGMMEGLLVSYNPFLGDFLDPPLPRDGIFGAVWAPELDVAV